MKHIYLLYQCCRGWPRNPINTISFLLIIPFLLLAPPQARAQGVPAVYTDPAGAGFAEFGLAGTNGMYGWSFQLTAPTVLTGLGWYDEGGDGLFHAHEIGLWGGGTSFGSWTTLVTSLTIPAGAEATLDRRYRRLALNASLTLQPGYYMLAGTYEWEQEDVVRFIHATDPPLEKDPRLVFDAPWQAIGGGFRLPDMFILVYGVELGPMIFVEPIPEPGAPALLVAALLIWARCRTRRCASP